MKESDKGLTIPAVPPVPQPLAWGCTWGSAARRVCPSETSAPHSWPRGPAHTWWWAVQPQCCPQGRIIIVHTFHARLQFTQPLDHNPTYFSCKFSYLNLLIIILHTFHASSVFSTFCCKFWYIYIMFVIYHYINMIHTHSTEFSSSLFPYYDYVYNFLSLSLYIIYIIIMYVIHIQGI